MSRLLKWLVTALVGITESLDRPARIIFFLLRKADSQNPLLDRKVEVDRTRLFMCIVCATAAFIGMIAATVAYLMSQEMQYAFLAVGFLVASTGSFAIRWFFSANQKAEKRKPVLVSLSDLLANDFYRRFAVSSAIGLAVIVIGLFAGNNLLPAAGLVFVALNFLYFGLTFYRIQTGVFGYNAEEMKELIAFVIAKRDDTDIHPGSKLKHPEVASAVAACPRFWHRAWGRIDGRYRTH